MYKNHGYYGNDRPEIYKLFNKYLAPKFENRQIKILEIGCGYGGFKKHFPDTIYWAVESNPDCCETARESNINVINGFYDNIVDEIPNNYFDIVICNDVIEHMNDHDKFLTDIKSKCSEYSFIIGSVPNVRFITVLINYLFLKQWQYKSMGVLDYTHLRFFTIKSIYFTLTKNKYKDIKIIPINCIFNKPIKIINFILLVLSLIFGSDTKFMQLSFIAKVK